MAAPDHDPGPASRGGRRGATGGAGALPGQLRDALRRADRFARMRAGIVAGWAVISLATLWLTCSGPAAANPLGADVQVSRDSLLGVQLLVRNDSDRIWEDVVLTLDGRWRYAQPTMRPRDLVVLAVSAFKDGEQAAPRDHRPRAVVLSCSQGTGRFDLR
jgi:hypothetical protein